MATDKIAIRLGESLCDDEKVLGEDEMLLVEIKLVALSDGLDNTGLELVTLKDDE
jgi:hypothetical protein